MDISEDDLMKAVIITIGDELLIGQVINTNAAFIAEKLNRIGIEVVRIVTVGDSEEEIVNSFQEHYQQSDVVIVTGGLGPTHDDVTRRAVCRFFETDLVPHADARENIQRYLSQRDRAWSD